MQMEKITHRPYMALTDSRIRTTYGGNQRIQLITSPVPHNLRIKKFSHHVKVEHGFVKNVQRTIVYLPMITYEEHPSGPSLYTCIKLLKGALSFLKLTKTKPGIDLQKKYHRMNGILKILR